MNTPDIKDYCRPEVQSFALEMERLLRENDDEKGDTWKTMPLSEITTIFIKQINKVTDTPSSDTFRERMPNLANVCMMIWHRYKR